MNINLKKYLALEDIAGEITNHFLDNDKALSLDELHEVIELTSQISHCFVKIAEKEEYNSDFIKNHAGMIGCLTKTMNATIIQMGIEAK